MWNAAARKLNLIFLILLSSSSLLADINNDNTVLGLSGRLVLFCLDFSYSLCELAMTDLQPKGPTTLPS